MSETKTIELNIERQIIAALVNADESGLSKTDIEAIDQAILDYGPHFHVICPSDDNLEASFSKCDITRLYADCLKVSVQVTNREEQ